MRAGAILTLVLAGGLVPSPGLARGRVVAVAAGPDGAAQLTLGDGRRITVQKERGQVGIGNAQGKQVAYHVGPLHGERSAHCELHDVASGRTTAVWEGDLRSGHNRPVWAAGLLG